MPDAGDPPLLEIDITRKLYRGAGRTDVEAISGLRFSLHRGTVTCLLGPSGCGKTTALRILMGLDRAFEGSMVSSLETIRLGVVFQDARLLPWRSVETNIRLAAPDMPPAELAALLAELGLAEWRRYRPGELSVGMARRVALARALSVKPNLLVLDEAFVSLDERGADLSRKLVFEAARGRGVTVVTVTHSVREALRYSDVILVLAPRPTRVLERVVLSTPLVERDEAWIEDGRRRLRAGDADLQP